MNDLHSVRKYTKSLVQNAKELRQQQTPAETIVWRLLRNRRFSGYRFRRQQPILHYIADFFCARAKVIIELDGETHVGREEEDRLRQTSLESLGYRVVRFLNHEVYEDMEMVEENIWLACQSRLEK